MALRPPGGGGQWEDRMGVHGIVLLDVMSFCMKIYNVCVFFLFDMNVLFSSLCNV